LRRKDGSNRESEITACASDAQDDTHGRVPS
jgi:hypothetical protein